MKRTKKSWQFFLLQLLFMFIVPCVMIWVQYGDLTKKYKLSVTAIILILFIFVIFKKIFINKWLKSIDIKIINIEANALSITEKNAIESNKKAWRTYSLWQLFTSSIIPILFIILAIITIKAVEQGLIKLYGCLIFCVISIFIGIIFRVAEIYSMKLENEEDEK